MSKGTAIIGMLVSLAVGYFLGGYMQGGHGDSPLAVIPAAAVPDPAVDRYKVPVGNAPTKGGDKPKVTIVQWSDFQCPFCTRVEPTLDQILKTYGKDVKVAWKNNPLPFHNNAMPAAQLAMFAHEKGKFWEAHKKLFANQQALDRPSLEKYAGELGLDVAKFKEALDQNKYQPQIKAEQEEAAKFGARGTPAFFINGRPLSGAQPFDAFKKVIDEEIANATKAINAGVAAGQVYDALTRNAKAGGAVAENKEAPKPAAPAQPDPALVYKVPAGNSAFKGEKNAKVTIIQFSDFQCPFCSRVEPTITDLLKDYPKDLKVVWKNNPLPFHPQAGPAAKATLAAGEQGKFWQMHEKIFADQQHLDDATFEKYANELGLNVGKWKSAYTSTKFDASIKEDQALAEKLGARGTPSFFINGRPLRGAQPKEQFKAVIDKEIEAANAALKRGVKPADLYAELTKDGKEKAEAAPAPAARPGEPDNNTVYKAMVGDAPVKGAKNAKVTIVEFSDFQCPFCSRVEPTIDKVVEEYKDTVRVVFKQLPLPFHNNAHAAAEASLAAKAQGGDKKFWEMHKKLFANQQGLDRPSLEKYAGELGLNVEKFKADLDSGKFKAKVDQELAEGNKIGARGTPSFFINGKPFVGAQPYEAFKAKIDAEIQNADALVKKGTPANKIYDALMKDAKAEVAAAPAGAPPGGAPPEDKTVYKVDAGNAPAFGPKSAPVTIVAFSDFQCPFCSRVVPTMKQIEEKYKGKVRVAFRNYPLPFHDKAQLAAEAAMAANDEGKFWQMHDKMFANQQALDRPSLEKYAGEIGLNVDKFKSALDSGKHKAAVTADVQYANGLGGGMGTPTFFINGRKIAGAMPFDAFASVIDDELKKKGK
jgi:protein-disulfide isomerase